MKIPIYHRIDVLVSQRLSNLWFPKVHLSLEFQRIFMQKELSRLNWLLFTVEVRRDECTAGEFYGLMSGTYIQRKTAMLVFLRFRFAPSRTQVSQLSSSLSLWFLTRVPQCVLGAGEKKTWESREALTTFHYINYSKNCLHQGSEMVHKKVMCGHSFAYISGQNLATSISQTFFKFWIYLTQPPKCWDDMCTTIIHSLVEGYLHCFQLLTITNSAATMEL